MPEVKFNISNRGNSNNQNITTQIITPPSSQPKKTYTKEYLQNKVKETTSQLRTDISTFKESLKSKGGDIQTKLETAPKTKPCCKSCGDDKPCESEKPNIMEKPIITKKEQLFFSV